jgi:hypothetical protein
MTELEAKLTASIGMVRREKLLKVATRELYRAILAVKPGGPKPIACACRDAIESIAALAVQDARDTILGALLAKLRNERDKTKPLTAIDLIAMLEEL